MVRKTRNSSKITPADLIEVSVVGILVFLVVYFFAGQLLEIVGTSMYPTLHHNERLLAEKVSLKFKELERGEIVIAIDPKYQKSPKRLLVKRVVGLPGETFLIKNSSIYIDENQLEESYLPEDIKTKIDIDELDNGAPHLEEGIPYEIPENHYILLGDNRGASKDSREWGAVSKENIVGRALLVFYPITSFRLVK